MKYLTKEELVKLPTKRLLAYKRKHLGASCNPYELLNACLVSRDDSSWDILVKNYEEYCLVKEVLSNREHVERK